MSNGLTHPVKDGTVTTFPEFLRRAARQFGLPDQPGEPIEAFVPNAEDLQQLETAKQKLAEVREWSEAEADRQARAYYALRCKEYAEEQARQAPIKARYTNLIANVEAWRPPTQDHYDFKQYVLEQLRTAMAHDVSDSAKPQLMDGETFKQKEIEFREHMVTSTHKALERAQQDHEAKVKLAQYWETLRESVAKL